MCLLWHTYARGLFLNRVINSGVVPKNDAEKILLDEYYGCTFPFEIEKTLWVLVGVTLLIGIATILFWIFPTWKIFRNHLSPLSNEDAPDVIEFLDRLCCEVELKPPPKFLWNPLNATSSGLAFGCSGKYYVAISGGLVTQYYTNPSTFRAILLHELAHLKNADVDKTYFATAVWQAFLVVAVLPVLIFCFGNLSVGNFIDLIVLTALIYLIRNSILRVRELYADARADMWDKQNVLEMVLASLPHQLGS
jgi:Zn-dependent protease with chaperone function